MNAGDMIEFKQIVVGRDDNPPYSLDGQWRIGLLLESDFRECPVLYRGKVYLIRVENMRPLEKT